MQRSIPKERMNWCTNVSPSYNFYEAKKYWRKARNHKKKTLRTYRDGSSSSDYRHIVKKR